MTIDEHRSQYRFPNPLYDKVKASAEENRRSVNAEVVVRLEASFQSADQLLERIGALLAERDARLLEEIRKIMGNPTA